MSRKRFSEREVIATLIHQGTEVRCYRTAERVTLANLDQVEREHLTEIAIGGADTPANCAYSLRQAHAVVTNGTKATTAGSSKNRIAKATNPDRMPALVREDLTIEEKRARKAGRTHRPMNPPRRDNTKVIA